MWRPGNLQNPPKSDFCIILHIFQQFCQNGEISVISKKLMVFLDFKVFGGPSRSDLDFEQGIQRFREGSRNPGNQ